MNSTEIRQWLNDAQVLPSKQLGQNFLIDANIAQWIVAQLDLQAEDTVVEVGPGTGALTQYVLGKVKRFILIEFDAKLAAALMQRFENNPQVHVYHADAASIDPRFLFKFQPLKFLGNLPYSCGGAIMKNLLSRPHPFCRAVVMLQKEVIDRLVATEKDDAYGMMSLRTQMDWKVKALKTVPPEAFHPKPKIDSSVALLTPRENDLPPFSVKVFDELIRRSFTQRRKQLKKQMPDSPPWNEVVASLGCSEMVRGEDLSLQDWVKLARIYDTHPLKHNPQKDDERLDVVDEADQVISQATRKEIHEKRFIHRAVHVFILNKRGDVWLQQRSLLKDSHPGAWDSSVSGHVDSGESYQQAAMRELKEEMGVEAKEIISIGRITPSEATGWEHVEVFLTHHHGSVWFPYSEIRAAMPFPMKEIQQWILASPQDFSSGFLESWKILDSHLKKP